MIRYSYFFLYLKSNKYWQYWQQFHNIKTIFTTFDERWILCVTRWFRVSGMRVEYVEYAKCIDHKKKQCGIWVCFYVVFRIMWNEARQLISRVWPVWREGGWTRRFFEFSPFCDAFLNHNKWVFDWYSLYEWEWAGWCKVKLFEFVSVDNWIFRSAQYRL